MNGVKDAKQFFSGGDDGRHLRQPILLQQIKNQINEQRANTISLLEQQIEFLVFEAMKFSDAYYAQHMRMRKEGDKFERGGRYQPLVRLKDNGVVEIAWRENKFPGAIGNKRVISTHIRKPRGQMKYRMSDFKYANSWETEAIEFTENEFARIRDEIKSLKDMKKTLIKM